MFEVWRNVYILQGRLLFVCRSTRRKTSCQPRSQPMRNCKLFWLNTGKIEWWTIILFTSTCIMQCLCDNSWNWFCNVYPNTFHQWLIEYFNRAIAEHYINISLNITRWSSTVWRNQICHKTLRALLDLLNPTVFDHSTLLKEWFLLWKQTGQEHMLFSLCIRELQNRWCLS